MSVLERTGISIFMVSSQTIFFVLPSSRARLEYLFWL